MDPSAVDIAAADIAAADFSVVAVDLWPVLDGAEHPPVINWVAPAADPTGMTS